MMPPTRPTQTTPTMSTTTRTSTTRASESGSDSGSDSDSQFDADVDAELCLPSYLGQIWDFGLPVPTLVALLGQHLPACADQTWVLIRGGCATDGSRRRCAHTMRCVGFNRWAQTWNCAASAATVLMAFAAAPQAGASSLESHSAFASASETMMGLTRR